VLERLRDHPEERVKLHSAAEEHHFRYRGGGSGGGHRTVYFPTPYSLAKRAALADEYGGLAVWELGQGLPWLLDALL
jgi:hypothetical protein